MTIDRRTFLARLGAGLAAMGIDPAQAASLKFGAPRPFSFDALVEAARTRAAAPYAPRPEPAPEIVAKIDYEAWGKIAYPPENALFAGGPQRYPATFFHLGTYFRKPVRMHVVEGGAAREILYDPAYFDMPADSIARKLPQGAGFAGFRFQEARDDARYDWRKNDWVAFLGASYFRAIGELHQYGGSARGVAIDSALGGTPEEFPDFTDFYIDAAEAADGVKVQAALDGPSVAGAYSFDLRRGKGVVTEIDAALFLRKDVERLGLAPLTSMYWFSETRKPEGIDWRPEVHDSDGLSLWTGAGERLWRPLNDPAKVDVSAFVDEDPRGFGLMQRDRLFDHYQDGVNYERRPSMWVEPLGKWGKGAVELIEIPTDDEINDNVVALWRPAAPAKAGDAHRFGYRLHWLAANPFPDPLARCVATRVGRGGQPGQPRPAGVRKIVVEFLGGPLASVPFGVKPEAVLTASRGTFAQTLVEAVPDDVPGHWRAEFDVVVEGDAPVELRCFLRAEDKPLTETWTWRYHPF